MMKRFSQLLISLLLIVGACIDPLDVNIDSETKLLIVEGSITTQQGPHLISLAQSAKYGNIFDGFIKPLSGWSLVIRDSDGEIFEMNEVEDSPGLYTTSSQFRAVVGKSYTLLIKSNVGVEYTSLPELVTKAPELLDITAEFVKRPIAEGAFSTGLMVSASFQDNPEEQNFYMWKNNGTYKIKTFPENFLLRAPPAPPTPAPKDCCAICWVNENSGDRSTRLLADNNVNGNIVVDEVAFIEDEGTRYTDKYLIRVENHTLSREAFQFFSQLNEQMSINGDIFDPPPATTRGNIINLSNPDENVIGYFRASDVSIDSLFLTPDMLLEPVILRQIDDDCRLIKNGYTEEPSYW